MALSDEQIEAIAQAFILCMNQPDDVAELNDPVGNALLPRAREFKALLHEQPTVQQRPKLCVVTPENAHEYAHVRRNRRRQKKAWESGNVVLLRPGARNDENGK